VSSNVRRLVLGATFIVLAVVGIWLVARLVASDRSISNLGDDEFEIGAQIVRDSASDGPIFLRDLINGGRDIYVTHDGSAGNDGFVAFTAYGTTGCLLQYDQEVEDLFDDCEETRWPADGAGLLQYPVRYNNGTLYIDINFQERTRSLDSTTTTIQGDS
jgi:hypothetical protein